MEKNYASLVQYLRNFPSSIIDDESLEEMLTELFQKVNDTCGEGSDPTYTQYPLQLLKSVLASILVTDNALSFHKKTVAIVNSVVTDGPLNLKINKIIEDIKRELRIKNNHRILSNRFDMDSLYCHIPTPDSPSYKYAISFLVYKICGRVDTYNLEVVDKLSLILEEYFFIQKKLDAISVECIMNYIIVKNPDCNISNIVKEVIAKLAKTSVIPVDELQPYTADNFPAVNRIAIMYQKNKEHNAMDALYDYARHVAKVNTVSEFNRVLEAIYLMYTEVNSKFNPILVISEFIHHCKKITPKSTEVLIKLIDIFVLSLNNELVSLNNEAQNLKAILSKRTELSKLIHNQIEELSVEDIDLEDKKDDEPYNIFSVSEYEKNIVNSMNRLCKVYESSFINWDTWEQTFGDPNVLAKCDADTIRFIGESFLAYPFAFENRVDDVLHTFMEAYKIASNEAMKIDDVSKRAMAILSTGEMKNTIDNISNTNIEEFISKKIVLDDNNQEDMYNPTIDGNVYSQPPVNSDTNKKDMDKIFKSPAMNDVDEVIKNADENKDAMRKVAATIGTLNEMSETLLNEMKVQSYLSLALDKVKKGYDKLDDKAQELFNGMDRLEGSFDKWFKEGEKKDARLRIVQNKMLPSMSKMFKTMITVGALALISPFLAIVALVVKFVSAKNAYETEKQAVADELEVELDMIDKRISDASDNKDMDKERKLRLLKKRLTTYYGKLAYKNSVKWGNKVALKSDLKEISRSDD